MNWSHPNARLDKSREVLAQNPAKRKNSHRWECPTRQPPTTHLPMMMLMMKQKNLLYGEPCETRKTIVDHHLTILLLLAVAYSGADEKNQWTLLP